jgi:GNAT superfamily N-acetyltransferase
VSGSVRTPKGLEIRVAGKGDLDALVAAMGQPDFFTDRIGRTRQGVGELLVAWLDGNIVGDVYLYREVHEEPELRREFPGVPLLNHLEVTPAWQGRGIGTALIHACEAAARAHGHDVLILGVGLDNPDAKRLYERLGYVAWPRGPIVTRWTEPDGAGGIRYVSLDIDVMVRSMAAPAIDAWVPWHPRVIADRLAHVDRPWHVAGGWALELWRADHDLGPLRDHGDLEIAIPRAAYRTFAAALGDLDLYAVHAGAVWPLRGAKPKASVRQVWVAEGGRYRTDLFLETGGDRTWIFRRDDRVRRPMGRMVARTRDGVPYLRPEGVLLYKAAGEAVGLRPKDRNDFDAIAPDLDAESARWLVDALSIAYPAHQWIATLQSVAIR